MSTRIRWNTENWGTKVIASTLAVKGGVAKNNTRGILLGTSLHYLKVVKEGTTTSGIYAKELWEKEDV